jgi:hypothetical protein
MVPGTKLSHQLADRHERTRHTGKWSRPFTTPELDLKFLLTGTTFLSLELDAIDDPYVRTILECVHLRPETKFRSLVNGSGAVSVICKRAAHDAGSRASVPVTQADTGSAAVAWTSQIVS